MNVMWIALAGGAAAFAHCLGMCGGFALHLAQGERRAAVLGRQLLWHAGRITTYVFLGAMAGFLGAWVGAGSRLPFAQNVLAYGAGGVMVLMGLVLLGLVPLPGRWLGRARTSEDAGEGGLLATLFRQFVGRPSPAAALVLGIATGFLLCPIVVGFLALSVHGGSVLTGMGTMAAMGLGTAWSLLLLGMTGHLLAARWRRWGAAVGGTVLVLLGLATALRGTEAFHHLLGCPPQETGAVAHPCCTSGEDAAPSHEPASQP